MGRIGMTAEYIVQWPEVAGILPPSPDVVLKWTHSILQEEDYCSEWDAAHRATELALQFGFPTFCPPCRMQTSGCRHEGRTCVTFCPTVEVFLGEEESIHMHAVTIPAEALCTGHKPWSNRYSPLGTKMSSEHFCFDRDLACPVPNLFDAFMHPTPCQSPYPDCPDLCRDPLSFCKAVLIPEDHATRSTSFSLDVFTAAFISEVRLNSEESTNCSVLGLPVPFSVGFVTCPGADDSTEAGTTSAMPDRAEGSGSAPSRASSPIRLPPFAQQMMANLSMEFLTNPVRIVQGFVVRTWYLHHINIPLSLQARQIMITGPPHLWRAQVLTTWADLIIPGEDLTLDLVSPNPPRNWHEAHILFDLILAQGMYSGRFSGLVTISPTITEQNLRMYAVAVSFDPVISGQDIVTGAGIQPLCNRFDCLIFHFRDQLYIDFNQVHRMQHGHGFVVYLSRKPSDESASSVPTAVAPSVDPFPEPSSEHDAEMEQQQVDDSVPLATDPTTAAPVDEGELRRVTLYRLNRPNLHGSGGNDSLISCKTF